MGTQGRPGHVSPQHQQFGSEAHWHHDEQRHRVEADRLVAQRLSDAIVDRAGHERAEDCDDSEARCDREEPESQQRSLASAAAEQAERPRFD